MSLSTGWSLWRWACLRSTGFPARLVLELGCDELAATVDRLLVEEAEVVRARDALIKACKAAADIVGPEALPSVQRALKKLWKSGLPAPIDEPVAEQARAHHALATARVASLAAEIESQYARASIATSEALRRLVSDDRFRQAMLWQNRHAVRNGTDWLMRQPIDATDAETRKNERLVASYLQRYCLKNDTIGFFGPVGWARLGDRADTVSQQPGPSLVADRTVYFEYWAIDALAARLSADPAIRPFIAPRRLPAFRLEATTLHYPIEKHSELPPAFAAVLAQCDGARTARSLAAALTADPESGLESEADVFDCLDELVESKIIHWELEIPTAISHPERALSALLAKIEDAAVRDRAEAMLADLFVVLLLSGLSFLGLGIQPPAADWGSLVRENLEGLSYGAPAVIMPALAIASLTIGVNLLIDNLPSRRAPDDVR